MNNYKEKLKSLIDDYMKQYDIKNDDLSFGNSGQVKGYVMGLKTALDMMDEVVVAENATTVVESATVDDGSIRRVTSTRRSRSSR